MSFKLTIQLVTFSFTLYFVSLNLVLADELPFVVSNGVPRQLSLALSRDLSKVHLLNYFDKELEKVLGVRLSDENVILWIKERLQIITIKNNEPKACVVSLDDVIYQNGYPLKDVKKFREKYILENRSRLILCSNKNTLLMSVFQNEYHPANAFRAISYYPLFKRLGLLGKTVVPPFELFETSGRTGIIQIDDAFNTSIVPGNNRINFNLYQNEMSVYRFALLLGALRHFDGVGVNQGFPLEYCKNAFSEKVLVCDKYSNGDFSITAHILLNFAQQSEDKEKKAFLNYLAAVYLFKVKGNIRYFHSAKTIVKDNSRLWAEIGLDTQFIYDLKQGALSYLSDEEIWSDVGYEGKVSKIELLNK